eukprot:scaffold99954_cov18-Cyclotella_meneghiniana.AAC.1
MEINGPAHRLRSRWISQPFIKLIETEFGEDAYNGENIPIPLEHDLERNASELQLNKVNEEKIARDEKASKRQKKQKDTLCSPKKAYSLREKTPRTSLGKNDIELENKNAKNAIVVNDGASKRQMQSSKKTSRKCLPKKAFNAAPK